jgi:hypothetical protein
MLSASMGLPSIVALDVVVKHGLLFLNYLKSSARSPDPIIPLEHYATEAFKDSICRVITAPGHKGHTP